ncbi:TetR/AcrR family transcriptional regulator [Ketobacter sp.]|uniref:TetR/AcrR family transcriptional regulator n=1 Tax=Ketobacter sp. TaxID=2083498 RepID=UPI000F2A2F9D|nr:TetR/AcrR family transcriptional regulator [Ketobacter sp.]MEE2732568.1 TetR/AcrR family transcriptional regulator [Pseudomonadota bacterium]RLU00142.1 MAG: TetR/AcrR family transcriptional regulator [Ketobacter sp.]
MPPAPRYSPQEQEDRILASAVHCIEESSLLDFTMSAISKSAGLSMGSIYKHMQSKEDVLVALGYRSNVRLKNVFSEVLALPLPVAVRLIAVQLFCHEKVALYSFSQHLDTLLANEAILQRASERWLQRFIEEHIAIEALFRRTIFDACDAGELSVSADGQEAMAHEMVIGLWSLCVGHTQVIMQRSARNVIGRGVQPPSRLQSDSPIIRSVKTVLNSYPWKTPVTDELIMQAISLLEERHLR